MKPAMAPRKRARGVAAVELALLMPLLLALTFGTTELGRAIYTYNTLDKTVRDAVRHLSQHGPGDPVIIAEAKCLAVFGNLTCVGTPVAPGLTTGAVAVCDSVSIAFTFTGVAAKLGFALDIPDDDNPCTALTDPANDSCD